MKQNPVVPNKPHPRTQNSEKRKTHHHDPPYSLPFHPTRIKTKSNTEVVHRFYKKETRYTPRNSLTTRNHMAPMNLKALSPAMLHSTTAM